MRACRRFEAILLTGRVENKPFLLVIDGLFDDADIKLLGKAGWDGVFLLR
jgi:hypothetical protein